MLGGDIPLADHVVELLHGTFPRIVHLTAGSTHEKTVVGRVPFSTTLLASESLPASQIAMLGRSAVGAWLSGCPTVLMIWTTGRVRRSQTRRGIVHRLLTM